MYPSFINNRLKARNRLGLHSRSESLSQANSSRALCSNSHSSPTQLQPALFLTSTNPRPSGQCSEGITTSSGYTSA